MRLLWEQLDIPSVAFHIAIQLPVDHRSSRIIQTKRLFDSSNKVSFQQSLKKNIVCSYLEKKRQLTIYTEKDVASKMMGFLQSATLLQTNKQGFLRALHCWDRSLSHRGQRRGNRLIKKPCWTVSTWYLLWKP